MVVRITRTRPVAAARIVRKPRSGGRTVRIALSVTAEVVDGAIDADALLEWVTDAIARYHSWRAGWVGIDCAGTIKLPEVKECPENDEQ